MESSAGRRSVKRATQPSNTMPAPEMIYLDVASHKSRTSVTWRNIEAYEDVELSNLKKETSTNTKKRNQQDQWGHKARYRRQKSVVKEIVTCFLSEDRKKKKKKNGLLIYETLRATYRSGVFTSISQNKLHIQNFTYKNAYFAVRLQCVGVCARLRCHKFCFVFVLSLKWVMMKRLTIFCIYVTKKASRPHAIHDWIPL